MSLTAQPGEVLFQWDVARDQTPPVRYNLYRSSTSAFTNPIKSAQVAFDIGEGWSTDPTTKLPAFVSNPNASISVNGVLSDWSSLTSFGLDPQDASGSGDVADWAQAWLAHDTSNLYLAVRNHVSITQLNAAFCVYLDTDNTRTTGFRGGGDQFPVGAEFALFGTSLYRYTGTGLNWQWTLVGTAGFSWAGTNAELFVPRAWVDGPSVIHLFFLGDNPSVGGTTLDAYPDAALQSQGASRSFLYVLP